MRIQALVVSIETRKWAKGDRKGEMTEVTLFDASKEKRCKTPLQMTLADDDQDLRESLEGETIMVDVTEIKPGFRGNGIEVRGTIVREPSRPTVAA